jgi:hypothetical protein
MELRPNNYILFILLISTINIFACTLSYSQDSIIEDSTYETSGLEQLTDDSTSANLSSTNSLVEHNYFQEPQPVRKFDQDKWEALTKDLNYYEKKKLDEVKKDKEISKNSTSTNKINLPVIPAYVFYIIIVLILVIILIKLFDLDFKFNKKIKTNLSTSIDLMDEEIHESDLDRYLKEALAKKDYKLSIRIYYLMVLKELTFKNWITWKKDKTNKEYLHEMYKKSNYTTFKTITTIFENVWYGEKEVNESEFNSLSLSFKNYIDLIRKSEI